MLLSGLGFASLVYATWRGGSETRPMEVTQQDKKYNHVNKPPFKGEKPSRICITKATVT